MKKSDSPKMPFATKQYHTLYFKNLPLYAENTAKMIDKICKQIFDKFRKKKISLVCILRGGLPAGLLVKYWLSKKYRVKCRIIEIMTTPADGKKKIDKIRLHNILRNSKNIVFIDGWTATGEVYFVLKNALKGVKINWIFVTLVDLAKVSDIYATNKDTLVPWAISTSEQVGFTKVKIDKNGNYHKTTVSNRIGIRTMKLIKINLNKNFIKK